jgi:hypothetical protein
MFMGWDNDAVWMRWRPEEGTRLHLVTLDGSQVRQHRSALTVRLPPPLNLRLSLNLVMN